MKKNIIITQERKKGYLKKKYGALFGLARKQYWNSDKTINYDYQFKNTSLGWQEEAKWDGYIAGSEA